MFLFTVWGVSIFFLLKAIPHNFSRVDFVIYLRLCGGSKRIFMIVPWVEKKYLQLYAGWKKIYEYTLGKIKIFTIAWRVQKNIYEDISFPLEPIMIHQPEGCSVAASRVDIYDILYICFLHLCVHICDTKVCIIWSIMQGWKEDR